MFTGVFIRDHIEPNKVILPTLASIMLHNNCPAQASHVANKTLLHANFIEVINTWCVHWDSMATY